MRVAILCPGPSLARQDPSRWAGDVVIGVNRAAVKHPVRYWAALDADTRRMSKPEDDGREWGDIVLGMNDRPPVLLLLTPDADRVEGEGDTRFPIQRTGAIAPPELLDVCPRWCDYSATAAVVWAATLGAEAVRMFGADMRGEKDFSGASGENRDERRWSEETAVLNAILPWLRSRGISFERVPG